MVSFMFFLAVQSLGSFCTGLPEGAIEAMHLHYGTTWSESIQVLPADCCRPDLSLRSQKHRSTSKDDTQPYTEIYIRYTE